MVKWRPDRGFLLFFKEFYDFGGFEIGALWIFRKMGSATHEERVNEIGQKKSVRIQLRNHLTGWRQSFINAINSERNALCKVWDKADKYRKVLHTMGYGAAFGMILNSQTKSMLFDFDFRKKHSLWYYHSDIITNDIITNDIITKSCFSRKACFSILIFAKSMGKKRKAWFWFSRKAWYSVAFRIKAWLWKI